MFEAKHVDTYLAAIPFSEGLNLSFSGCCGAHKYKGGSPVGIHATVEKAPVEEKHFVFQHWMNDVKDKTFPLEKGKFLNMRTLHRARKPDALVDWTVQAEEQAKILGGLSHVASEKSNLNTCYFTNIQSAMVRGSFAVPGDAYPPKTTPYDEGMKELGPLINKTLKGKQLLFIIREGTAGIPDGGAIIDQRKPFDLFVKELDWDKPIFESELFNNRNHNRAADYLRLLVFQL